MVGTTVAYSNSLGARPAKNRKYFDFLETIGIVGKIRAKEEFAEPNALLSSDRNETRKRNVR